jgi:hypothetical protein
MESMKRIIICIVAAVGLSAPMLHAQEIDLSVEITMEQLTPAQREYLADFKSKLQNYVDDHRWTTVDFYGDRIPVSMSINFTSGTDAGEFVSQVVIASQRRTYEDGRPTQASSLILRILDQKWSFTYIKGMPFYHDEFQFNDLASFIDFYMYLILGIDFDSMEPLQGTPYYQKAMTIAQRSQSSNRASEWQGSSSTAYSKINFLSELQNAQFDNFRTALYWYYYEGIDFIKTEKDMAQHSVARAIENLMDAISRSGSRSIVLNMWLEAKSAEFCSLLEGYSKKASLMNTLSQVDPVRSDTYRRCF